MAVIAPERGPSMKSAATVGADFNSLDFAHHNSLVIVEERSEGTFFDAESTSPVQDSFHRVKPPQPPTTTTKTQMPFQDTEPRHPVVVVGQLPGLYDA
jgi:hypothetical protein